ncbi:glycosyltransferase family 2 protein [Proteus mirabilis]|nr:glycosyltransferase family 2 protein [Proteus mirabilis]
MKNLINMNRLSVIITTHNRPFFLKRAINSVLSQTIPPYEIIIVDDNSDIKINIDEFKNNKGIIISYIYNKEKKGSNYSRNLGAEKSTGNILMFLDDDDFWLENKIKVQLELLKKGYDFVYSGKNFVSSTNLKKTIRKSKESHKINNIWHGNYLGTTSSIAIKKHIFIKAGKFDELLESLQDYDLWIRVLKITPAIWDGKHNINYTIHRSKKKQISTDSNKHLNSIKRIQKKYLYDINQLDKKTYNVFYSRMNHVIARSYRRNKDLRFFKYWMISLKYKINIRTISLLFIA